MMWTANTDCQLLPLAHKEHPSNFSRQEFSNLNKFNSEFTQPELAEKQSEQKRVLSIVSVRVVR